MDTCREPLPDPEVVDVRLTDPGEIAAGLPQLLGFRPRESVVLVSLTGPRASRVGLTVRGDLPPPEHVRELASGLVRHTQRLKPSLLRSCARNLTSKPPP